jgi:hypothetical protein
VSLGPAEILVLVVVVVVVFLGPRRLAEAARHPGPEWWDVRWDLVDLMVAGAIDPIVAAPRLGSPQPSRRGGSWRRVGADGTSEGSA